jgi:D-glycero-D-manno-heptose 1,7-bisphosphate phosphatase
MRRAVFLDRDGVINRKAPEGDYIKSVPELVLLPLVGRSIHRLNQANWLVVMVTNQRGIARKLMTVADLEAIHEELSTRLEREGARIDLFYSCAHDTTDGCDCRKPRPGMILAAGCEHDLDLNASWMIGDRPSDIEAGRSAGCRTILVGPLSNDPSARTRAGADHAVSDLAAAVDVVLSESPAPFEPD